MAVDVICSATSSPPVISPRISFSHDLKEAVESIVAVESDHTIDFDFCVDRSFSSSHEISSADELFSNGRILPVQIKKTLKHPQKINNEPDEAVINPRKKPEPAKENPTAKRLIELLSASIEDAEKPSTTKHFWQFRRSASVNCQSSSRSGNNNNNNGNNYGLLRPLNFLRRNNSTGSAPNPKQSSVPEPMKKQRSLKEGSMNSSVNSYNQYYYYNHGHDMWKRDQLRKSMSSSNRASSCGNNGVGINVSPVLNINPGYIAKGTVSLFGIASFFCRKKSKKKTK